MHDSSSEYVDLVNTTLEELVTFQDVMKIVSEHLFAVA
jgi:hypothetical protein